MELALLAVSQGLPLKSIEGHRRTSSAKAAEEFRLGCLLIKTEVLDEKPGHFICRLTLAEEIRVPADSMLVIKVPGWDESV